VLNPRSQIPVILGRLFLATTNVFNQGSQPDNMDDQSFEVNLIENLMSEHNEEIELETKCDNKLESDDLSLDEIVNSTIEWALSPSSFYLETASLAPPSIESTLFLELKILPKHLKYTHLSEQETLPVIIASDLTDG